MDELLGSTVVVDSGGPYVYLGLLEKIGPDFIVLRDADAHDLRDTPMTTREQYVVRAREHGIVINRSRVWVNRAEIVAVSRLDDVVLC